MRDNPAWVGIARIIGGPFGTIATLQQKIHFNDFMFGTICEKVRVQDSRAPSLVCYSRAPLTNINLKTPLFKGSSDQNHYIFEIHAGKRRIRYRTTLKLNL